MNKRQTAAKTTKRKLITTALEMIKEHGFDAVNVEDITQRAGVAKGTFYTYFKRKEDIVLEISRTPFSEIAEELAMLQNWPLPAKLTHYFHRFMECVESCGIHICRQWTRDVLDPTHTPKNKDGKKWEYDCEMLQNILTAAVKNGELKADTPIETLTYIIICELYGMMTSWCMSDGKFEPLDWTDKFCSLQLSKLIFPYLTTPQTQKQETQNANSKIE